MSVADVRDRVATINDVLNAMSVLLWDSRTMMPPGGTGTRGEQMATLAVIARDMIVSDDLARAADRAGREVAHLSEDDPERRAVDHVRAAIEHHRKIPAALVRARTALRARASATWAEARRTNDFALFAPDLAESVALARELADAIGYDAHPYDALISIFEPGETSASLDTLFATLRGNITPLVQAIGKHDVARSDIMSRAYPPELQREFGLKVAERFGYDFSRGRLDPTTHPFEISFTRNDVRITTRYHEDNLVSALQGIMHEAGHGLYEQNIDSAYTRTALATDLVGLFASGGVSFGVHESQSRLWENHIGRSRRFWELHYGELVATFPAELGDVPLEAFYRAFHHVEPDLIRVEADELTYDFHIMLRVGLERRLIEGSLAVADLPDAWNGEMRSLLGVEVPEDRLGVLQDIHWSTGQFGTFCNYTIGNVMAAQLFEVAERQAAVAEGLEHGDYAPLRAWLTEHVHRHGRRFSRDELLVRATGRPLDPAPYVNYLTRKYCGLYGIDVAPAA